MKRVRVHLENLHAINHDSSVAFPAFLAAEIDEEVEVVDEAFEGFDDSRREGKGGSADLDPPVALLERPR